MPTNRIASGLNSPLPSTGPSPAPGTQPGTDGAPGAAQTVLGGPGDTFEAPAQANPRATNLRELDVILMNSSGPPAPRQNVKASSTAPAAGRGSPSHEAHAGMDTAEGGDHADTPKALEYSHEYLMHGWEGLHSAEKLADLGIFGLAAKGAQAGQGGNLAKLLGSEAAARAVGTGIGVIGGVQAVAGAAVAADAVRRKDWAQVADGASHVGEGGVEAALALKLSKGASFLDAIHASKAMPALGILGAVGHAFHNAKEAEESGHKLKWVGVAGDVVSAAGGAAWLLGAPEVGAAVAAGGMLVDIVSGFADQILHHGDGHPNHEHGDNHHGEPHQKQNK